MIVCILAVIGGVWVLGFLWNVVSDMGPMCSTQAEAEEAVRKYRERNP